MQTRHALLEDVHDGGGAVGGRFWNHDEFGILHRSDVHFAVVRWNGALSESGRRKAECKERSRQHLACFGRSGYGVVCR